MAAREKPLTTQARQFVEWHLGKGCFHPHTGQDWPAWMAFVHLVQCWCRGGGHHAIDAMRSTLRCAQPHRDVLQTFVQVIPCIGDWCHVGEIWPQIAAGIVVRDVGVREPDDARLLRAWERCASYDDKGKVTGTRQIYTHGWSP